MANLSSITLPNGNTYNFKTYTNNIEYQKSSASGSIAHFEDGTESDAVDVIAYINPVQSGSGDPSPTNVRPISGFTGMNISASGEDMTDPTVYPITFPSEAGTVYGGYVDVTKGKLVVDRASVDLGTLNYSLGFSGYYTTSIANVIKVPASYAASNIISSQYKVGNNASGDQMYIQSASSYLGWVVFLPSATYENATAFKTAMNGVQLVYELAEPIEYDITPTQIATLLGENNIWHNANGDTDVEYIPYWMQKLVYDVLSPLSSFHTTVGDGSTTSFTIAHYLNTKNILVSVNITDNNVTYIAPLTITSSGQIGYSVIINSNDSITISFTSAPPLNGAEVSVISAIAYTSASD